MINFFGRCKFLLYGLVILGVSLLFKVCGGGMEFIIEFIVELIEFFIIGIVFIGELIKVGLFYFFSGIMVISEIIVVEVVELAIEEINVVGGVLGRFIEVIKEDGVFDWLIFVEKVVKLID